MPTINGIRNSFYLAKRSFQTTMITIAKKTRIETTKHLIADRTKPMSRSIFVNLLVTLRLYE